MSYSVPLSCNECCPRCGIQKKIIFHASLDTLLQLFPTFHLLLVTLNYSNMQQKGSDTVTSLNVFEDRYSSLQTKPDAVLLKQQQEDLFQNECSKTLNRT